MILFLDVETTADRTPVVVGILDGAGATEQVVGPEIEAVAFLNSMHGTEGARVVTYNGSSFDFPVLRDAFGFDPVATLRWEHVDALPAARRAGLRGALRALEVRIGWRGTAREEGHVYARWRAWTERGDRASLEALLRHNREDLEGLAALYRRLVAVGAVAPRFG